MEEFKKLTKYLKDNIALILFLVYSISFTNYYIYYKSFGISIFSYVGLNHLIFFTSEYVFNIILIIIIFELIFFILFSYFWSLYEKVVLFKKKKLILYLKSEKRNREKILNIFQGHYSRILKNVKFIVILLGIFVLASLPYKLITIPAYFLYLIYFIELVSKERMYGLTIPFALFIILFAMIFTTLHNSYIKRFEKENYTMAFKEGNNLITTKKGISSLNYLGETSTNIFLYDIKFKKAKIYNKSNLTDFEIQNSDNIDKYIILIRNFYPIRIFIQMINDK